jgi:hypothetical protein
MFQEGQMQAFVGSHEAGHRLRGTYKVLHILFTSPSPRIEHLSLSEVLLHEG